MIVSAKKYTELQATFEATQAALAGSEATVSALTAEVAQLKATLNENVEAVEKLSQAKAELETQLASVVEAKEAVEASVAGFEEKLKVAAAEKALETVAKTGTPVIDKPALETEAATAVVAPKTYSEFNATFNALSEKDPKAAGIYFNAHCNSFFKK